MTAASPHDTSEGGLQAERTALAWTRTSLALLANGAVLMLRDLGGSPGRLQFVAVSLAVLLALATYLFGRRRQRTLSRRPLPSLLSPRREVHLLAAAVLVLVAASLIAVSL